MQCGGFVAGKSDQHMAQVSLGDIDVTLLERLAARAATHQRSVEEEIRVIIEDAASQPQRRLTFREFVERTQGIRERTARRGQTDSVDLVREDRER
jgi:plasmid stability protein